MEQLEPLKLEFRNSGRKDENGCQVFEAKIEISFSPKEVAFTSNFFVSLSETELKFSHEFERGTLFAAFLFLNRTPSEMFQYILNHLKTIGEKQSKKISIGQFITRVING